jgi:hypothetical protein
MAGGNSSAIISGLLYFLLVGICVLAIWWVGTWFIGKLGAPGIVLNLWDGLFILVALFVVINFLLGLAGHPLVTWS